MYKQYHAHNMFVIVPYLFTSGHVSSSINQHAGKQIPRHLKACSTFEIVILSKFDFDSDRKVLWFI